MGKHYTESTEAVLAYRKQLTDDEMQLTTALIRQQLAGQNGRLFDEAIARIMATLDGLQRPPRMELVMRAVESINEAIVADFLEAQIRRTEGK